MFKKNSQIQLKKLDILGLVNHQRSSELFSPVESAKVYAATFAEIEQCLLKKCLDDFSAIVIGYQVKS